MVHKNFSFYFLLTLHFIHSVTNRNCKIIKKTTLYYCSRYIIIDQPNCQINKRNTLLIPQRSPVHPPSQPFIHNPVSVEQGIPLLQCPQSNAQFGPYL